jgi:hypothetical protein
MRIKAWLSRRVVQADLRPSEMVIAWGPGVLRLEEYLRDSPRGRLFWRAASLILTFVITGVALVVLTLPFHHPDAEPGAPAWWTWSLGLPAGVGLAWLGALLLAGLRAMHRHRTDPVADRRT